MVFAGHANRTLEGLYCVKDLLIVSSNGNRVCVALKRAFINPLDKGLTRDIEQWFSGQSLRIETRWNHDMVGKIHTTDPPPAA